MPSKGEASYAHYYPYSYQLVAEFCVKQRLACVLDFSSQHQCDFSASIMKELFGTATLNSGMLLLEKQCRDYRWRIVDGIQVFEPRNIKQSRLGRIIPAFDLQSALSPERFILRLSGSAGLIRPTEYALGAKTEDKPAFKFKTPAGTLRSALISAAKQYPHRVWVISVIEGGYLSVIQ